MRDGYEYVENTYSLKGLTEFIGDHPEFMSVVSFNVNDPDSGIFYQADVSRTMGTLSNFFLLVEYERQVSEGLLDPNESVQLSEVEKLTLAKVSEEAHKKTYTLLEVDPDESTTLDKLVAVLIETNDLAASDYLWYRLGYDNIKAVMDSLEVEHTDVPLPFAGLYMSVHPEITDTSSTLTEDQIAEQAYKFRDDQAFHNQVKAIFEENRLGLSFIQERDALALFPQTTPREIAELMAALYKEEILSPEISRKVKEKMQWVFGGEAIQRSFSEYGAIYDNRMGMLSGIDVGTSIYDGHTSAQAVFFDRLPVAFWLHLSANHMQEDYQQRLIWDPALYEVTVSEIQQSN